MKILAFFVLITFSGSSQTNNAVIISPVANVEMDENSSYIYCATTDIIWSGLRDYLGELPKSDVANATMDKLNEVISKEYRIPIERDYFLACVGTAQDSIIEKINSDLKDRFKTSWQAPTMTSQDALLSFAYLKKDVVFRKRLDDGFGPDLFNGTSRVEYFGVDVSFPDVPRKNIVIHDFKGPNNFIIELKCTDTLDEIYLAKIPHEATLQETFQEVSDRIDLKNAVFFDGRDILKIPYLKLDTTANLVDLEGVFLSNDAAKQGYFQSVQQRTSFDLNEDGIKLESIAAIIMEFADFDIPEPRVFAFDSPFLIVMKRKNHEQPYFLYWVSGTEFMRTYELKRN